MDYIGSLQKALGKTASKQLLPMNLEDVLETYSNVDDLIEQFDYKPATTVFGGVKGFVDWYLDYCKG